MLRRIEGEDRTGALLGSHANAPAEPVVTAIPEAELETPLLPQDHPKWVKDALTVSTRAREAIARLRPVVVKILTFWDHRVRSIVVGNARVSIDPSGSYRRE